MITNDQINAALISTFWDTYTCDESLYQAISTYLTSNWTKKEEMLEQIQAQLMQMRADEPLEATQWAANYASFIKIIDPTQETLKDELADIFET